jgi:cytochrome c553
MKTTILALLAISLALFLFLTKIASATPAQLDFFESRIRPVLATECYDCHGPEKQKGGLRLDSRDALLEGGDTGPAIIPGNPAESLLFQAINHSIDDLKMPKDGAKLDRRVLDDFSAWIRSGAVDPRDQPLTKEQASRESEWPNVLKLRSQWWSLRPISCPTPPATDLPEWSANPIDAFVLTRIREAKLEPAPRADPATLIRRISYILTGFPPAPAEIDAFVKASANNPQSALEALVDQKLASPAYGETWARHWMDWVRYAETYGSEGDPPIPYAFRYRDYLIRALNNDTPYPQLVREAIAGDLLPIPRLNPDAKTNESILGTAQLRMVLHGFSPVDSLDEMITFTDNQVDVVSKAFQGLTVSCARCHNHKFDAISQADYYSWFGIFSNSRPGVVNATLPGSNKSIRDELNTLKQQIKTSLANSWLQALPAQEPEGKPRNPAAPEILKQWNLRTDPWFTNGIGIQQGPTRAGEFSINLEGDKIISHIRPAGVVSDLVSNSDPAVLMSPRFINPGGTLWIRGGGSGNARARYVVNNYPRTGTIHKAIDLNGDGAIAWRKLDLEFWKGNEISIEITTGADLPAETKINQRSGFAVTDVAITTGGPPPDPTSAIDPRAAIQAWLDNSITDPQAELLDSLLHNNNRLPNSASLIPTVAPLLAKYRELESKLLPPLRSPGVIEADASDHPLFIRGDHKQPSDLVPRHFLDAIDPAPYKTQHSGRLELANSITRPDNPLTSRVIVNRLWHHVFGRGIVATTDNFGRLGSEPTHPELLDLLASDFNTNHGSIKHTLRLILTSRTFQLDHHASRSAGEIDPENKLLSHFTVRRLPAEAIRDAILLLSGTMNREMFGPSVPGNNPRRSIYVNVVRNDLDPFLAAFDTPVPSSTRGNRDSTNVPAQSLSLLNDPSIIDWSGKWAKRILNSAAPDDPSRITTMFNEALGRNPTPEETKHCLDYLHSLADQSPDAAWRDLAQSLINLKEMIYLR